MRAGELNKRVTIQRPTRTVDARSGQRGPTAWEDVGTRWAAVWPRSAREQNLAGGGQGQLTTYEVRMRYTDLVTPDCRLACGTLLLALTGIQNVDLKNVELRIDAVEWREGGIGA